MTSKIFRTNQQLSRPIKSSSVSSGALLSGKTVNLSSFPTKKFTNPAIKKGISETTAKKRRRQENNWVNSKKTKLEKKIDWKLTVALYDEEMGISVNFRCFYEDFCIPEAVNSEELPNVAKDDDCKTEEKEVEVCSEYLAFQLERSILSEPCDV
jgi:hypothetical protein